MAIIHPFWCKCSRPVDVKRKPYARAHMSQHTSIVCTIHCVKTSKNWQYFPEMNELNFWLTLYCNHTLLCGSVVRTLVYGWRIFLICA